MASAAPLVTDFVGRRGALFAKALKLSVLTVLTLGIYRFWMKTRLRRWYWSAIRPGGHPLEYVGDPLEKLLGFLLAVVFLSFYIGVFNLLLMFVSFSVLADNFAAYALSFVVIIPFIFFAQYRARRYLLARTRWRGIRFGLEPGAWGYAWRAMGYWLLVIVTLGALWPLMSFKLEKYRTDRTWFGSARLEQGGRWTGLIVPALPALLGLWASLGAGIWAAVSEDPAPLALLLLSLPLLGIGWLQYRVRSLAYLTGHKHFGARVHLSMAPRLRRVLGIYLIGNVMIGLLLTVVAVALALTVGPVLLVAIGLEETGPSLPSWVGIGAGLMGYFAVFVFWDVLRHVFIRMPLLAHFAETLEIANPHALAEFEQRARDGFLEAGGFAEALDVGAAL